MLTELASPIELCLIEEVTLGKIVVERTRICLPCDGLHKIKVIFTTWLLLIGYHTRYRVDILILGCMIEVIDTSACLHKHVIPRYDGRCLQSLSNKGKILLERKVGVDTGCGGCLLTMKRKLGHRVRRALLIFREITPNTIAILWQEGIMRC